MTPPWGHCLPRTGPDPQFFREDLRCQALEWERHLVHSNVRGTSAMTRYVRIPVCGVMIFGDVDFNRSSETQTISYEGQISEPSPYSEWNGIIVETMLHPWVAVSYLVPDGTGNNGHFHRITRESLNETWRAMAMRNRREGYRTELGVGFYPEI